MADVNVGAAANDGTGDPLRQAFIKLNQNDQALTERLDNLTQNAGKMISSRSAAVNLGQAMLPAALARILVFEGDYFTWRGPGNTDDQLFSTYPNWGALTRIPASTFLDAALGDLQGNIDGKADLANSGKLFASRQGAVNAGQAAIPAAISRIMTIEGEYIMVRGPGVSGDALFETYPLWGVIERIPFGSVISGIANGMGIIPLTNISHGVPNEYPTEIPETLAARGVTSTGGAWVRLVMPNTNTGPASLKVGDDIYRTIVRSNGNGVQAGDLVNGRGYLFERRAGNWRMLTGDISRQDVEAMLSGKADILDSGKVYNSRQAAIDRGPALAAVGRIITVEEGGLAIRAPFQTSDDPLFESGVRWGVVARIPAASSANTFTTNGGPTGPSGLSNIPSHANYAIITNNGAGTYTFWRTTVAPEPPVERDNLKMSADGRWWFRVANEEAIELRTGRNQHLGGADSPSGRSVSASTTLAWTVNNSDLSLRAWRVIGAPSDGLETDVLKKDANDRWWRLVWQGSDGQFQGDESFRAPDDMDEVWYKILTARDGSAWLGSYVDGSWAAPTAFGAFRWPGDDLVILETQSGEPILAVAPDGTLIFKERS